MNPENITMTEHPFDAPGHALGADQAGHALMTEADALMVVRAALPALVEAIATALKPVFAEYATLRTRLDALDENFAAMRADVTELQHAVDPSDRVPESALQG